MKVHDERSAMVPVIKWYCCLAKDPQFQPQCKYYVAWKQYDAKEKKAHLECANLGNYWGDGMRNCTSEAAKEGYFKALRQLRDVEGKVSVGMAQPREV